MNDLSERTALTCVDHRRRLGWLVDTSLWYAAARSSV